MNQTQECITTEEWNELVALKNAINDNPASVHPDKQERFTELYVKSLCFVGTLEELAQGHSKAPCDAL